MKVFITGVAGFMGSHFQISGISIPGAVLIWVMIYPMMMKVDFQSVKQIGKNPKGTSGHMGYKLADQAVHHVWNCLSVFICRIQIHHISRIGNGVPCRSCAFRSCSVYGDGVCVEYAYKRKSCLYGRTGGDK